MPDAKAIPSVYTKSRAMSLLTSHGEIEVIASTFEGHGKARFVLLHGNPGSMLDMQGLYPLLLQMGDVALFDAPGFGRSPTPANLEVLEMDSLAEVALCMLEHLGWSDAVFVGHSHGGGVAQRLARFWPDRVRALVLLGTLGAPAHLTYRLFPLPGIEALLAAAGRLLPSLPCSIGKSLVRHFMDLNYSPINAMQAELDQEYELLCKNTEVLQNMVRVTRGNPCMVLEDEDTRIRVPTVFIHGTKDQIVPLRHARRIHELMIAAGSPSRFVAIEGGGHMIMCQAPERCAKEIEETVSSVHN